METSIIQDGVCFEPEKHFSIFGIRCQSCVDICVRKASHVSMEFCTTIIILLSENLKI